MDVVVVVVVVVTEIFFPLLDRVSVSHKVWRGKANVINGSLLLDHTWGSSCWLRPAGG